VIGSERLDENSFEGRPSPILNENEQTSRKTFLASALIGSGALLVGILLGFLLSSPASPGSAEANFELRQFGFVEENSMYALQGESSRLLVVPKDDYWCVQDKIDAYVREQQELLDLEAQGDELGEEALEAWQQETANRFLESLPERPCPISGELAPVFEAAISNNGGGTLAVSSLELILLRTDLPTDAPEERLTYGMPDAPARYALNLSEAAIYQQQQDKFLRLPLDPPIIVPEDSAVRVEFAFYSDWKEVAWYEVQLRFEGSDGSSLSTPIFNIEM
jgi:hypothetical protein